MLPIDDMDCDKARFICPECAPDFVLLRATSFADVDNIDDEWKEKYTS